jgi:hypothetical protein
MESNITHQGHSGGLLSTPHFDEEATLLSARPVVPLQEIKTAERPARRLTFGLALLMALVIGAIGATLIYRQRDQAPVTAETAMPNADEAPAVSTGTEAGGGPADVPPLSASASVTTVKPHESAATRPRKPAGAAAQSAGWVETSETSPDEADRLAEEMAARRAERQEARRLRREAQREAWGEVRSRRAQRSDDLLRIREIFEGPPRPRRFQRWQ